MNNDKFHLQRVFAVRVCLIGSHESAQDKSVEDKDQ